MHVSARVSDELGNKLKEIAKETGRSESYYIKLALAKLIEDREDYLLAMAALEKKDDTISWQEAKEMLGLAEQTKGKKGHINALEHKTVRFGRKAAKKVGSTSK